MNESIGKEVLCVSVNDNMKGIEEVSEIRAYIIMGLSLLLPILLYIVTRSGFRSVLSLAHSPIIPMLILLLANVLAIVYLHVVDYREMQMVCGDTRKLLGAVLLFQPVYFVFREEMLGRSKKMAIVYVVVSTIEVLGVISMYVLACIRDVMEML